MKPYVEQRPEAIAAIKKSIDHWNDICYGSEGCIDNTKCGLCLLDDGDCENCSLSLSGNDCNSDNSTWDNYKRKFNGRLFLFNGRLFLFNDCFCSTHEAPEAEAMLEALVQLLPPADRVEYGDDMSGNNIVFYCKDCKQMFYASVNNPDCFNEESAQDVATYLAEGHRLETTTTEDVRANFNGCQCTPT